ncbi:hypothetical protein Tco_0898000 [Tanacetum coccineum]
MTAGVQKLEGQWADYERMVANLDQRLKSLIMSVLPDDQMNFVINYETTKYIWEDLILYLDGPSDVKENRVMDLKDSELASIFGKLIYEENLIDSIYETKKKKSLTTATPFSTAFFSTSIVQDFQDSLDDEEDTRSSQEYMNDLEIEFHEGALLAKSKRFFKKGTQRFSGAKATDQTYKWDEEEVSLDDNEIVKVKVLMALTDDESGVVGKESARNGEWVKISIGKHENTEILKENQTLRKELKELTEIIETLFNRSNKSLERRWLLEDSLVELEVVVVDLGVDLCHQQVVPLLEREEVEVEFGCHLEVTLEIEHEAH